MATKTIDVHEMPGQLKELLALVEAGGEIIVMDGAKTIARLVPVADKKSMRIAGLHQGAITTSDDFDEPLSDEFWASTA